MSSSSSAYIFRNAVGEVVLFDFSNPSVPGTSHEELAEEVAEMTGTEDEPHSLEMFQDGALVWRFLRVDGGWVPQNTLFLL